MRKYKVTVKYECEVDYDVMAESKQKAEENILRQGKKLWEPMALNILRQNISDATYTDYRTFNRQVIKQKDKTPAEF